MTAADRENVLRLINWLETSTEFKGYPKSDEHAASLRRLLAENDMLRRSIHQALL